MVVGMGRPKAQGERLKAMKTATGPKNSGLAPWAECLAGFLNLDNFALFIVPALGADAVRLLQFVAVGALGQSGAGDAVMRAPGRGAPF
jgi:hypothetical protein